MIKLDRQLVGGHRAFHIWATALLLGVLFAQAMTSIPRLSITFDEDLHIASGYSMLRTGDFRLIEEHPPLIKLLMSWPLLFSPQMPEPQEVPAWAQGDLYRFVRNEIWWHIPIDSWVIPCRIPIALLALLLGSFLFRWASDWFGPSAGLFALALLAFDPNILAHATVATVDLGATCLMFIAIYELQRYLTRPGGLRLTIGGITLGLALATKISALILLPVSGGLMLLSVIRRRRGSLILQLLAYFGVAFLTLWAVHRFEFGASPGLPFPVPAPGYWRSLLRVSGHIATGDRTYLLGEAYQGGRWYFFPVVFALKTPLSTFILLGMALLTAWRRPQRGWRELVLVSLPVSYFVASMFSAINLGYRHLLPILPFLYLFIARLAAPRNVQHVSRFTYYVLRVACCVFLAWHLIGTLCVSPHYLAFFNEIAGGARNGYRYLADSNVDWGQGLKALRSYLEARSWPDVRLSSFTYFIRPELYGIQVTPLPPLADAPPVLSARFNPAPGTHVISASTLRGLQLVADPEMYNWFWHREPDDVVANAMLVYHVHERAPKPTWLAQCSVPVVPLPPDAVVEGFGRADLHLLAFDCTQSWLYPDAGESAGWYVLHREAATNADGFVRDRLAYARLSFEQKIPHEVPPLTVFEWNSQAITSPQRDREETLWVAPAEWPPAQAMAEGIAVSPPVSLDGPLTFLGAAAYLDGETLEVETWWRVAEGPMTRPLSLMAHLLTPEGQAVGVADGLGVSPLMWRAGDVIVQRHQFPGALTSGDVGMQRGWILRTGAYWLDTMERWAVANVPEADALFLLLSEGRR